MCVCVCLSVNWVSICSGNGLSLGRCQAIAWTNAGLLSIRPLGTNFSEIRIKIQNVSFKKMHLKTSSARMAAIGSRGRWVKNFRCPFWARNRQQARSDWGHFIAKSWWRHQMETFSALLAICAGNSPDTGEFPTQRPVTQSFDDFFDLRLNSWLSKQWWGWWLRRHRAHYDVSVMFLLMIQIRLAFPVSSTEYDVN